MSLRDYLGPPAGWLGGVVAFESEVGRSDRAVIFITHLTAYPEGFTFKVVVLTRDDPGIACHEALNKARERGTDSDEIRLSYEIEFSDKRKGEGQGTWISTYGSAEPQKTLPEHLPPDPKMDLILRSLEGSTGTREYRQDWWVWPLPPAGPLSFRCGWPAAGISVGRTKIDGGLVNSASKMARPIWTPEAR